MDFSNTHEILFQPLPIGPSSLSVSAARGSKFLHLYLDLYKGRIVAVVLEPKVRGDSQSLTFPITERARNVAQQPKFEQVTFPSTERARNVAQQHNFKQVTGSGKFRLESGRNCISAPASAVVTELEDSSMTLAWEEQGGDEIERVFYLFGGDEKIPQELFDRLDYVGACPSFIDGELQSGRVELFELRQPEKTS